MTHTQRLHTAISTWISHIKDRHADLLRNDPGYRRDLTNGITAVARAILHHPAVVATITTLITHLLQPPGPARTPTRIPPRVPRLWDQDWTTPERNPHRTHRDNPYRDDRYDDDRYGGDRYDDEDRYGDDD